jgi:hypothetical protein
MSDVDVVMALDLEKRVNARIREELIRCATGAEDITYMGINDIDDLHEAHKTFIHELARSVLVMVREDLFTNPSVLRELQLRLEDLDRKSKGGE